MRILFCDTTFEHTREALAPYLPADELVCCPKAELAGAIAEAEVAIPLMARLDAAVIARGKRLRMIHQYGVGLEGVDVGAAKARGIIVARVPSADTGNAIAVAEQALALMLALARRLPEQAPALAARKLGAPRGITLYGSRVAILGLGNIGRALAERLRALGMTVVAMREHPQAEDARALGIERVGGPGDLEELVQGADFVVVTLPVTESTRGLVNREVLESMKRSAYLVNVSRGPVVDYEGLLWALRSRAIAGAGLDVYWEEPVDPADPILRENVVASPHVGGVTVYSYELMARALAANIERLRAGRTVLHAISQYKERLGRGREGRELGGRGEGSA